MVGFSESQKVAAITKVFADSYKSPLSVVVVDNIERLIGWLRVYMVMDLTDERIRLDSDGRKVLECCSTSTSCVTWEEATKGTYHLICL